MKKALAFITYARSHYFALVLPSILSQRVGGRSLAEAYDVYVFQDGLWGDDSSENKLGHEVVSRAVSDLGAGFNVVRQPANVGVALHFDFIEKLLFVEKAYDFVVFCEDDLILAPGYLDAVDRMGEKFCDDPRVGMVSAHPAACTVDPETQRVNRERYAPMGHNWGFGLSRSFWRRRQPFVECYLALIRGRPYRHRDEKEIFRWLELCGFRGEASSQDYVKSCATFALGACKLSTFVNLGLPIGRSGLHCTPALFSKMGFDRAVVFDGDAEVQDLDDAQYRHIFASSGHQVGAANVAVERGGAPFDHREWLRRLQAGELQPDRLLGSAGEGERLRRQSGLGHGS